MDFASFFFLRFLMISVVLYIMAAAQGGLEMPSTSAWLLLLLAGTMDSLISRMLFYLALRRMRMSQHTIILTLSPVIAIGLGFSIFSRDAWPTTARRWPGSTGRYCDRVRRPPPKSQ